MRPTAIQRHLLDSRAATGAPYGAPAGRSPRAGATTLPVRRKAVLREFWAYTAVMLGLSTIGSSGLYEVSMKFLTLFVFMLPVLIFVVRYISNVTRGENDEQI